jgi:uncharacterized protein YaiE (UPF0345 family)
LYNIKFCIIIYMTTPTQYVYSKQQFVSDVSLNGSTTMSSVNVTGNVGIGNTNPATKLDISGGSVKINSVYSSTGIRDASGILFLANDGAGNTWQTGAINTYIAANGGGTAGFPGGLAFQTKNPDDIISTAVSTKMVLDSCGNLGVGTTRPGAKLSVDYFGIGVNQNVLSLHTSDTATNDYNLIEAGHGTGTSFVLKGSGNVGIGTTNPNTKMQVASALSPTLNTNFATNSDAYWTNNWGLSIINDISNNNFTTTNSNTRPALGLGLSTGLYPTAYITSLTPFGFNGWNPLMIDGGKVCFNTNSTGNVGIGTTSPSWLQTIQANRSGYVCNSTAANNGLDDFQSKAPFAIWDSSYSTYGIALKMGLFRDTGDAYIQCETPNTGARNILLQPYNGNVGIGTTYSAAKLDVNGTIGCMNLTRFYESGQFQNNDNYLDVGTETGGNRGHFIHGVGNKRLTFGTYGTEKMTILSGGNVGIGTDNPESKLHINGGNLKINSSSNQLASFATTSTDSCFMDFNNSGSAGRLCVGVNGHSFGGNAFTNCGTIGTWSNTALTFATNTFERMRILTNGNVGIGTNSPSALLHVNGDIKNHNSTVTSDKRIKTNIVDIDDSHALNILRQIKPKTYDYVDVKQRGNYNVIGFIAQEIEQVIPNAISLATMVVPNFYTNCQITTTDVSNILLVTSPIDLSWNPLHGSAGSAGSANASNASNASDQSGNAFVDANGNACSDASGNKHFKIQLKDLSDNSIECKTTDVLDKRSFLMDVTGSRFLDSSGNLLLENNGEYFLYGQEVDDFHYLDKSYVYTVATSALQDIDRIVQAQQAQINAQQAQINAILAKIGGV